MRGRGHLCFCIVIRVGCVWDSSLVRMWASTGQGLAYFKDGRSVAIAARLVRRAHFIAGDKALA